MNLADFHFIRPFWLLALLPYIGIVFFLLKNKLSRGNWTSVCDADLLPYLLQEKAASQSRWPLTAGALAALLTIIAIAGPTWDRLPSPAFRNDSALVIALNLSRTMNAEDVKPSRLIRARYKISDILAQRKDGQTALLVYAGDAFTVTPLTDDAETIESQLEALTSDIMPTDGNNTELALKKAVDLFKQAGLQKGQILLLTDQVNEDGLNAAERLDTYSLSVLGVGTIDGAPIALTEGGFLKDQQGSIIIPKLKTDELAKLAEIGKGRYQTITANDADVKNLLTNLDQPAQQNDKEDINVLLDQWDDKGPWLLAFALPLAALSFRKGLLCWALLLLLPLPKNSYAFTWQDLWQTKNQQAQQAYQNKQFEEAANLFDNPDWKAAAQYKAGQYDKALENLKEPKTQLNAYNQGNALAQSGQLKEALKAYDQALALNPEDADAKFNKELVEKELKKQEQEQKNKDKQDKQDQKDNKDEQSKDKQDQQNSDKSEEQKPEQSEEQKTQQQQADEQNSAENKEQQEKEAQEKQEQEKKAEEAKAKQADEKKADKSDDEKDKNEAQAVESQEQPTTEQQQANEQWLKRIPDDPAGLLKRKFKYQYGQRNPQGH
ncbi:MAG: VWA domain-containing protein [Methylococcales bacterium]|nr:VWA domain-containing protein [Methylococcales bacterium]